MKILVATIFYSSTLRSTGYKIDPGASLNKNLNKDAVINSPKIKQNFNMAILPKWSADCRYKETTSVTTNLDKLSRDNYWYNARIHTLGNIGLSGRMHAAMAPILTWIIDEKAYGGIDIRKEISQKLRKIVNTVDARVLDMCCGVGMSTRALQKGFPDADEIIGIDTSSEMLDMARWLSRSALDVKVLKLELKKEPKTSFVAQYSKQNAERTNFPKKYFDLVTIMYAFHEAPFNGRNKIVEEARRVLRPGAILALLDLDPNNKPSMSMLAGEPYLLEYQNNIKNQIRSFYKRGFSRVSYEVVVPGHVGLWILKRT